MFILDLYCDVAANCCGYTVFESSGTVSLDGACASNYQCRGSFGSREEATDEGERLLAELVSDGMDRVSVRPGHSRY